MRPLSRRKLPPVAARIALLALGALAVSPSMAQSDTITVTLSASPNPSTTGSYTVSGSLAGARTASFTSYRLSEAGSSGPIVYYGIVDPASFSFPVSGKAVGSYTYRAQRCFYTPGSSAAPRCENLGSALTVRVVEPNTAPTANAGADASVAEGSQVTLDGSGSSDADDDSLTYAWTQTSGTTVTLSSATAQKPSFTAPELLANQNLVFSLTVNDGTVSSAADTVTVTVTADNDAPTANAGADQDVDAGASVTLSGSGSDPEGQSLSYAWSQTSGTNVTLSGANTASASFTAPNSSATLTFSLTVGDGVNTSSADTVTVTVRPPPNTPPVADAGSDSSVEENRRATLDGSGSSDADDDSLTYAWTQTSGAEVALSNATAVNPSFTAPELLANQNLVFSLTVHDGTVSSAADTVTVTVTADNDPPTAYAGADKAVDAGASVTLSGSGSDPEGQSLSYAWSQTSGTNVTLSGANTASASFTAPNSSATLTFSLTVGDGVNTSSADTVTVTVRPPPNTPPVADAGSDSSVEENRRATLDGSGSSDADDDSLTYAWTQTSGAEVALSNATAVNPSFTAPELLANQNLVFSLTVHDGTVSSAADTVTVTVTADNDPPTAYAGADKAVDAGASVTLSGSGSDPEGQSLSYAWTQSSGTSVSLSGATTASPSFTAPDSAATLTFSLTVSDGVNNSPADSVTVTVRPPVDRTPSFGSATIDSQSWTVGNEISELAAPVATGGDGSLTYGASGLPDGVRLMKNTAGHVFSGTPTAAGSGTAVLIVKDNDGDADALRFNWTAAADPTPDFGDSEVSDKSWTAGKAIATFTLPSATGGDAPVSYGASGLPKGVTVSPSLVVSGTPTETGMGTGILTARDADGDVDTLSFSWKVASPDASTTGTVLSTTPNPTTGHDFDVAGAYAGSRTYYRLTLLETGPWGHSRVWHPASLPFTQSVTNRVKGAYKYVLAGCYRDTATILNTAYQVCEQIGDALTVTVAGSETDRVAAQLADTYEVRTGDLNDDKLKDLYVRRTSSAAGGGLFQDVILQQAAGGEFTLVAAPPGSANGTKASTQWMVTEAVDVVLNDINLDGFVDVLLRGMKGVVTGASDRIVYAPGRQGGPPSIQKAVDDDLKDFLTEVEAWARNPNFFTEHVTTEKVYSHVPTTSCVGIPGGDLDRRSLPPWVITVGMTYTYCIASTAPVFGTRKVPTNDSPEARGFAEGFTVTGGSIDTDMVPGSVQARVLEGIFSQVLGTSAQSVLNGVLSKPCKEAVAYDSSVEIPCDSGVIGSIMIWQNVMIGNSVGITRTGQDRLLTEGEKQLADDNGMDINDIDKVRVQNGAYKLLGFIPVLPNSLTAPNGHIYVGAGSGFPWREDYAPLLQRNTYSDTQKREQGILIHELTHVWQNRNQGCVMICMVVRAALAHAGGKPYVYWPTLNQNRSKRFLTYNIERQAEMVSDRYLLLNKFSPRLFGNSGATGNYGVVDTVVDQAFPTVN